MNISAVFKIFVWIALFFLSACSKNSPVPSLPSIESDYLVQRYKVRIDPEIFVRPSDVGAERTVGLKVVDMRPDLTIGSGGGSLLQIRKFTISSDGNISEVVGKKVREGLKRIQFRPKPYAHEKNRRMKIEVLKIHDRYYEDGAQIGERINVSLKAGCLNQGKRYLGKYSSENEQKHKIVAGNIPNTQLINATLSLALQKIFEDRKMIQCLAN